MEALGAIAMALATRFAPAWRTVTMLVLELSLLAATKQRGTGALDRPFGMHFGLY